MKMNTANIAITKLKGWDGPTRYIEVSHLEDIIYWAICKKKLSYTPQSIHDIAKNIGGYSDLSQLRTEDEYKWLCVTLFNTYKSAVAIFFPQIKETETGNGVEFERPIFVYMQGGVNMGTRNKILEAFYLLILKQVKHLTSEDILTTVDIYTQLLTRSGLVAESVPYDRLPATLGQTKSHCLWILEKIPTFISEGNLERARAELGFVQGFLWARGEYPIKELEIHRWPGDTNAAEDE